MEIKCNDTTFILSTEQKIQNIGSFKSIESIGSYYNITSMIL